MKLLRILALLLAFSPPARMAPKRNLYGTGVGIAVVGGENSIQRHFGFTILVLFAPFGISLAL